MQKKRCVFVILLVTAIVILCGCVDQESKRVRIEGKGSYDVIQDAIDNASSGDTILVSNGTFYESLVLNKSLTLIGRGADETVIEYNENIPNQAVIRITGGNCTIQGFRVIEDTPRTGITGIDVSSSHNDIVDNSLEGVSPERIRDEFLKGVKTAKDLRHFLKLIDEYKLWDAIFPGLKINIEDRNNDKDPIIVIANTLKLNNPNILAKELNKLTYSSAEVKAITFLIALQEFVRPEQVYKFKKLQSKSGIEGAQIYKFTLLAKLNPNLLGAFVKFDLSVTGDQVQRELGIKPGPEMGQAIEKMEIDNFKKLL